MNQPEQLEKDPQTLWSHPTLLNISNISRQRMQEICFCGFRAHLALRELVWWDLAAECFCIQVEGGAVLSLLSLQPALGLLCTICVTRRSMGKGWSVGMWSWSSVSTAHTPGR